MDPISLLTGVSKVVGIATAVKGVSDARKARKASDPARIAEQEQKAATEAREKARALLASRVGTDDAFATLGRAGGPQGATRSLLGG
jgi:hypothetical protein